MTQTVPTHNVPQSFPLARVSRGQIAILLIILASAAFLRFFRIEHNSLWMDEIWSIEISTGRGSMHEHLETGKIHLDQPDLTSLSDAPPWWRIFSTMAGVTHPPLYHVILRWWMDAFGNREAGTRSLSALASLGAVLVLFDICRLLHGSRVALLAAGIMALSGAQIDFAQEARSYALLILLGMGCCDAVVRIEKLGASPGRLAFFAICSAALVLTHYLAVGAPVALGLYVLIRLRGRDRLKTIGALFAAAGVVLIVWGVAFGQQLQTFPSLMPTFLREAMPNHFELTVRRIIGLPAEFLAGETLAEAMNGNVLLIVAILSILVPLVRVFWRRDLMLWIVWLAGTLGFTAVADLVHGSTLSGYIRYTMLGSPAVFALIASFSWPNRGILRDTLPLIVLILLGYISISRLISPPPGRIDWRQMAGFLDSNAGPDDLVVFYNPDPWVSPGMWYMGCKYYSPESHRPWAILVRSADNEFVKELESHTTLWFLTRSPGESPNILPGWEPAGAEFDTSECSACRMTRIQNH